MRIPALSLALALALALSACGTETTTPAVTDSGAATDSGADAGTTKEVSFATQVLPILADNCGFCHSPLGQGPAIANKVYYDTKASIFALKNKAYVPGDSANSGLIGILNQKFGVGKGITLMPPPKSGRPAVSAADIAIVAKWIDEGAKDN